MRHTILLLITFLFGASITHAQATIDYNNFVRQASFLDTVISANANGSLPPVHGATQVWDYSALTPRSEIVSQHNSQVGNPDFPNAFSSFRRTLQFNNFLIPIDAYWGLDANGFYDYGMDILGARYSISTVTGGAGDSLNFPAGKAVYSDRFDFVKFPCNYEDNWSTISRQTINFELTVANFGLNKTPGYQDRTLTQSREVVGQGQLIIPTRDGSPSAPTDVLLIKEVRIFSDSFFLGGAPAPAVLLTAFGISQGQEYVDSAYYFYRPGFGSPVLRVGLPGPLDPLVFSYRPQGAQITTSVEGKFALEAVSLSPNPASQGQKLRFRTAMQLEQGAMQLFDMQGRIAGKTSVQATGEGSYEVSLPPSIPSGSYFYTMLNRHGERKGHGKLIVQ